MGRIVLFGATGYTGRLAAREMAAAGLRPVLAGRSAEALAALAGDLGGLEWSVAGAEEPGALTSLLTGGDVLVTTVGPYTRVGGTAAAAAIAAGAAYLDITGEPAFVRRVFDVHGPRAALAGVPMVPGMGYDFVPGNLAGALALQRAGASAAAVEVTYLLSGGAGAFSAGTRASVVESLLVPHFAWSGGRIVTERGARHTGALEVDGTRHHTFSMGAAEHFTLPRLQPGLREVRVYLGWFGRLSGPMHVAGPLLRVPGIHAASGALMRAVVRRSRGGPTEEQRAASRSTVVAVVRDADGREQARVRLDGPDAYTLTARLLAWGAGRAAEGRIAGTGALGPVEAFGLDDLRAACAAAGLVEAPASA